MRTVSVFINEDGTWPSRPDADRVDWWGGNSYVSPPGTIEGDWFIPAYATPLPKPEPLPPPPKYGSGPGDRQALRDLLTTWGVPFTETWGEESVVQYISPDPAWNWTGLFFYFDHDGRFNSMGDGE